MALTTEDANLVRQKALHYAAVINGGDPYLALELKAFFRHLSEDRGNPQLYFESFADLTGDTVISDAACKFYFLYARKQNTATDAFTVMTDHASTSAGDAGFFKAEVNVGKDATTYVVRNGLAQASGLTMNSTTTMAGTTDSTSGDGVDGFVIVGDP